MGVFTNGTMVECSQSEEVVGGTSEYVKELG